MMDKAQAKTFLTRVNDSGNNAVIGMIINLIAEGYTITLKPGTVIGMDNDEVLPAFCVITSMGGEGIAEATNTWLMEGLAETYSMTPETLTD